MSSIVEQPNANDAHHGHHPAKGFKRWLYTTNHKDIGSMYLIFSLTMFLIGGALNMGNARVRKKGLAILLTIIMGISAFLLNNLTEILTNVYTEFIISLREYNNEMNDFVKYVSNLDMLITKAYVSKNNNYCKPVINTKAKKSFIEAKDIRHPIIEKIQTNDTSLKSPISPSGS